jgi:hypothetical protein
MISRIGTTVPAILVAVLLFLAPNCRVSALQAVDKNYLANVQAKTRQLLDAVELLQQDVVVEMSGGKEKQLFQKADQVLHELTKMEKLTGKPAAAREDLYKLLDTIDSKVAILAQAASESAPKHLLIVRGAERIRTLTNDLHYVVSQGDDSAVRIRQVITRQAKVMSSATKQLSLAAQYALGATPGREELLDAMKKLADACSVFEKVTATSADVEKCSKAFAPVNEAWRQVVQGISLLPPTENVYLIRTAVRADSIHERLFGALNIKGERPFVTIRI